MSWRCSKWCTLRGFLVAEAHSVESSAYAAAFALAITNSQDALRLLSGAEYVWALDVDRVQTLVMSSIVSFGNGWNLALAILGLHLLCLGRVVFQSGFLPRFLGVLLVLAGGGYIIDAIGTILVPNYGLSISMFTFVGEVLLIFWLLADGIRSPKRQHRVATTAST